MSLHRLVRTGAPNGDSHSRVYRLAPVLYFPRGVLKFEFFWEMTSGVQLESLVRRLSPGVQGSLLSGEVTSMRMLGPSMDTRSSVSLWRRSFHTSLVSDSHLFGAVSPEVQESEYPGRGLPELFPHSWFDSGYTSSCVSLRILVENCTFFPREGGPGIPRSMPGAVRSHLKIWTLFQRTVQLVFMRRTPNLTEIQREILVKFLNVSLNAARTS